MLYIKHCSGYNEKINKLWPQQKFNSTSFVKRAWKIFHDCYRILQNKIAATAVKFY